MIKAQKVSLRYPDGTLALNDIDLAVGTGELVYITGPSGSGKTSLLKTFIGMEYPTSGTLRVLDQPMIHGKEKEIRRIRKRIGPVFQEFKLVQGRTALENVIMGMRFFGLPSRQLKENAINTLTGLGLGHKVLTKVENLSWGEAQRVAIARAVARKPVLILADEPTGNLDQDNALVILRLLTSFRDANTTVIITTHAVHLIENEEKATFLRIDNGNITVERRRKAHETYLK